MTEVRDNWVINQALEKSGFTHAPESVEEFFRRICASLHIDSEVARRWAGNFIRLESIESEAPVHDACWEIMDGNFKLAA
jgi:hypothetical protein